MLATAFAHAEESPKASSPESLSSPSKPDEGSVAPPFKSGRRRRRGRLTTPMPKVIKPTASILTSDVPNRNYIHRTIFLARESTGVYGI